MFSAIFQHHIGYLAVCTLIGLICGSAAWTLAHKRRNLTAHGGPDSPLLSPASSVSPLWVLARPAGNASSTMSSQSPFTPRKGCGTLP